MKYRISDLVDCLEDTSVSLAEKEIASAGRIKELTMQKIHAGKAPRRTGKHLRAAMIAAVLIVVLSAAAFAASELRVADLFRGYFSHMNGNQVEVVENLGTTELPPAVTSGGITVTPLAVVADDMVLYVRLQLRAPEGTVLDIPDEEVGKLYLFGIETDDSGSPTLERAAMLDKDGYRVGTNFTVEWIDETPSDNTLDLFIQFRPSDTGIYNQFSGRQLTLSIPNIWFHGADGGFTVAYEGPWDFTFTTPEQTEKLELDVNGMTTPGSHESDNWIEYYGEDYDKIVDGIDLETELTLRYAAISNCYLALEYTFPYHDETYFLGKGGDIPYPVGGFGIVMKDGSTVDYFTSNGTSSPTGRSEVLFFSAPIDYGDIDYFYFGEIVIPVNG